MFDACKEIYCVLYEFYPDGIAYEIIDILLGKIDANSRNYFLP